MPRSLFAQEFKRLVGRASIDCLRDRRMYEASALLTESDLSCDAIAGRVGYGSGATLSSAFHRRAGRSPTACRRNPSRAGERRQPRQRLTWSTRARSFGAMFRRCGKQSMNPWKGGRNAWSSGTSRPSST